MTQVSRRPMPKALEEQMHTLFRRALIHLKSESDAADFLEDILTPTERIMLGKRLAIAILLTKGYDHRTIHTMMRVSVTTVSSVHFWLKFRGKGYKNVIEKLLRDELWATIIADVGEGIGEMIRAKPPSIIPPAPYEVKPQERI